MDNRIGYIDAVKGIVMLIVILGHIGRLPGFISGSIYSFHMPLFFVVSGFFIKPQNSISLKKQVKALLLPYAVVGGGIFLYKALSHFLFNYDDSSLLYYLGSYLLVEFKYSTFDMCGGAVWFLIVLLISRLIVHSLLKEYSIVKTSVVLIAIAFISILITKLFYIVIPFGIQQAMVCSLFVFGGYLMKSYNLISFKYSKSFSLLILLMVVAFAPFLHSFGVSTRVNGYSYGMINLIISLLLSWLVIMMVRVVVESLGEKKMAIFRWCGRFSIVILAVHSFELEVLSYFDFFDLKPFYFEFLIRTTYILFISWVLSRMPFVRYIFNIKL